MCWYSSNLSYLSSNSSNSNSSLIAFVIFIFFSAYLYSYKNISGKYSLCELRKIEFNNITE